MGTIINGVKGTQLTITGNVDRSKQRVKVNWNGIGIGSNFFSIEKGLMRKFEQNINHNIQTIQFNISEIVHNDTDITYISFYDTQYPNKIYSFPKASYNFVPLPEIIVPAEGLTDFDSYSHHTGEITVTIKAESDIFSRGENENFLKINDRFAIAGSTVRGMTSTLVEILSYSNISNVEKDTRFFYRDLRNSEYKDRLNHLENVLPYYIKYTEESGYELYQALDLYVKNEKKKWLRIKDNSHATNHNHIFSEKYILQNNLSDDLDAKNLRDTESQNMTKVSLIRTGFIFSKQNNWIIGAINENSIPVNCSIIINNVLSDEGYKKEFKKYFDHNINSNLTRGIPCFALLDSNGTVITLSHTPHMRIQYEHNVGTYIPDSKIETDITQSIFGKNDMTHAGKVYFDDFIGTDDIQENSQCMPKVLGSPMPTSYNHYLESQNAQSVSYNQSGRIRGHKLYWQKANADYLHHDQRSVNSQVSPVKTLKPGSTFTGTIRFTNLTDAELGALLYATDLPDDCRHKIGMGKPIGLGIVRLTVGKLTLYNDTRYDWLNSGNTDLKDGKSDLSDLSHYKNAFEAYLKTHDIDTPIWPQNDTIFNKRLYELYLLMRYDENDNSQKAWLDDTDYMELGQFQKKMILPSASEVVNRKR